MRAASSERRQHRTSVKRQAVLDVLSSGDSFRSAQELYIELGQRSIRIGLTTVYRILHGLADERIAETQRAEDGEMLYRLRTDSEHRHYLLCRGCGHAVGFTPTALEEHTSRLTDQYQYADVAHHIDLYGTCPRCRGA